MTLLSDSPTAFYGHNRLPVGVVVLRIFMALYLVQWGILHFAYTGAAIDVYARWFGVAPDTSFIAGLGLILIVASIMMALGLFNRVGFGVALLFQGLMIIGLIPHLVDPYGFHEPPNWINHGLIAQVPALAGYIALYQLRTSDRLSLDYVLDKKHPEHASRWPSVVPGNLSAAQAY